jgi:ABC-type Fe3+-hydroxamate transport system substrate-binding protein
VTRPVSDTRLAASTGRRGDRLVALGVGLALALSGCSDRGAPPDDRPLVAVEDARGVPVRVRRPVRRLVTTVPGLTETVIALGLRDALVAVSEADTGIPRIEGLPRIRVFPGIQAEALTQFAPDLVLVDPSLSPRDVGPLRERFATFAADSRSLDGLSTTFERLGVALDRQREVRPLVEELAAARLHAPYRRTDGPLPSVAGEIRVLLLSQAEPVIVLGPGSLLDSMLRACGAHNVASDLGQPSGTLSSERIRERAPDWILVAGGTFPDSLRAAWSEVPAVKSGRIADATANDLVRAGPRTASALRRLSKVLRGELPPEALGKEER